jgi:hypothetical protein
VAVGTEASAPTMPMIREHEKHTGSPYLLVDGTSRMIGWQWNPPLKGGPQFVIAARSAMGGLRILERCPLAEDGWLGAWHPGAGSVTVDKVTARLARRTAEDMQAAQQPADLGAEPMLIVATNEVPGHRITEVHGDVFGLIVRPKLLQ